MGTGSLTADAVLLKQVFSDDFNRVSTQGLVGPWSWYFYDSNPADSSDTAVAQVDGTAATIQGPNGNNVYESYVGVPLPLTGDLFFDFWVPATSGAGQPTYGFTLDVTNYTGIYIEGLGNTEYRAGTWATGDSGVNFTVTVSTWYRAHFRWTTERTYINVWKVSDAEPAGWLHDAAATYNFAGDLNQPPFLDFYYSPIGPTAGKMDNVEVWSSQSQWTGFGGFFLDAAIAPHFTADAIIAPLRVSADAILMRTLGDGTATSPTINASYSRGTGSGPAVAAVVPTAANGDLLLFICSYNPKGYTDWVWSAPPGWNLVQSTLLTNGANGLVIFSKTKASADTGALITISGATNGIPAYDPASTCTAMIVGINGVDPATPISYSGFLNDISVVTSHPTSLIVSPSEGLLVLATGGGAFGTWTPPSGMTEKAEGLSAGDVSLAVDTQAITDGAVGVKTAISSVNMATSLVWLVARSSGRFFRADAFLVESLTQFRINAVLVAKDTARLDAIIRKERRSYASRVADDGATAYYQFDDGSGVLTQGYRFTATIGPDGVIKAGYASYATTVQAGAASVAPALGTSWILPLVTNKTILATAYAQKSSSKVSIEAWIRTSQTTAFTIWDPYHNFDILSGGGAGSGYGLGLWGTGPGKFLLRIGLSGVQVETTGSFNDNVWHHVVGVWNGTDGVVVASSQLKIYVDGVEVAVASGGSGPTTPAPLAGNPNGSAMVGWGYYSSGSMLVGLIDEVAHYNYTALSPTQVLDHYHAGYSSVAMLNISSRAVIRRPSFGSRSFRADAYIVNPFRTQHPRDNTAHYDLDLDTFIVLAQALEVYPVGEDLHTVLTGILDRLDFLEGRSNDYPPSFGADAVLFKPDIGGSLTIDALKSRSVEETALVDAIVRLVNSASGIVDAVLFKPDMVGSLTIDALHLRAVGASVPADALIRKIHAASILADAIAQRSQSGDFVADAEVTDGSQTYTLAATGDAILQSTQTGSFTADVVLRSTGSFAVTFESVVRKVASASLFADAFVQPYFRADAAIRLTRSDSLAAAAIIKRTDTFSSAAFPVVVGSTHGYGSTWGFTPTLPSGSVGDLLIVAVNIGWAKPSLSQAGWTQLGNYDFNDGKAEYWYRVATGSDSNNFASTQNPCQYIWRVWRIANWQSAPQIAATGTGYNMVDPPNLSPGWGTVSALWLAVFSSTVSYSITGYPANYTDGVVDAFGGNAPAMGSASRLLTASSEDPGVFTVTGGSSWSRSVTIGVRPTPVDGAGLTVDTILKKTASQTFGANAFIQPYFRADAVIVGPDAFVYLLFIYDGANWTPRSNVMTTIFKSKNFR